MILMFVLYEAIQKMSSNIAHGDISRAGIILLQGLQLRAILECGYYSREGLIWGNTVCAAHENSFSLPRVYHDAPQHWPL